MSAPILARPDIEPLHMTFPFPTLASLLVAAVCLTSSASAQSRLQGEFIVRFEDGVEAPKWGQEWGLDHVRSLSRSEPIHLFSLSSSTSAADDWAMLRALRKDSRLAAVQFNHKVHSRETLPDDPSLSQQWHHVQSGDHDIDSDLAWDITTGGQTDDGTRIVVAVLEGGGANYNHPDLIANHWVNDQEIPDNGIDDDNNGFVDDHNGWHAQDGDDDIGGSSHGTRVSGMIGATGDNGSGGVGVNWDVDIMQVDMGFGGLSEANVIEAYDYPYQMRKLFNESQGERGAFVVATNASWGIDLADPADYPIWCDFYDVLGGVGILNCGATANQQYNIDTEFDMPTGCSSPYMVSVTATDNQDVRTFSGYGATTIDLAAPGDNVYLPTGSTNYGYTSGTSFASPCVAGAIALLYSAPCADLMGQALIDPQGTADLVLGCLLDGVDVVSNLVGETATGGRLNTFNSLNLLMANCGPLECLPEAMEADAACVYDAATDSVLTTIEVGVTMSSPLCISGELCISSPSGELGCDSLGISNGEFHTWVGLLPNTSYNVSYTVDTVAFDAPIEVVTPGCDALVPGCTGPTAYNYDSLATIDDGSCDFPCVDFNFTLTLDCAPEEISWEIASQESGEVVASVMPGTYVDDEVTVQITECLIQDCYTFRLLDQGGNGLAPGFPWTCPEGNYQATDGTGMVLFEMTNADFGSSIEHNFCLPAIFGCTDEGACNYNEEANMNNGTCMMTGQMCSDGDDETVFDALDEDCECVGVPAVYGCTDAGACNYDERLGANVDDGSCYTMGVGNISGSVFPFAGNEFVYTYSGVEGSTLNWSVDGGEIISGQGTSEVTVLWGVEDEYGAVYVLETDATETDGTGCQGEAVRTVQILEFSTVEDLEMTEAVLMPNPATGQVSLVWNDFQCKGTQVTVFDVLGAEVMKAFTNGVIDIESLAPGRYTVVASTSNSRVTLPLMVN